MEKKYIVGIDPGKNGAITVLTLDGNIFLKKVMPSIGKEFDSLEFSNFIYEYKDEIYCAYIEHVHSLFGVSSKATFSFGKICGFIEGIISAYKIPYVLVQPKKWQLEMFEGILEHRKPSKLNKKGKLIKGKIDTKIMSALACKRLFPKENFTATERSKKIHDGITDSILIAEYGRRKFFKR